MNNNLNHLGRIGSTDFSKITSEFKFIDPLKKSKKLSKKQLKKQSDLLDFSMQQGETADRQFKTSRNLIRFSLFIMIVQIFIAGFDIYQSNLKGSSLTTIVEIQSQQSETISNMSLNLLDLQSQVRNLEQENAQLKLKSEK